VIDFGLENEATGITFNVECSGSIVMRYQDDRKINEDRYESRSSNAL
jgi:hypothetical protein